MAQKSKKQHIVTFALPLFLANGFKGTSVDMVVKASQVSKATVYNHFPDKAALMLAVLRHWIDQHKPLIAALQDPAEIDRFINKYWFSDEAIRLYAIVIGEGWRFPVAQKLFWEEFDQRWRTAFKYFCERMLKVDAAEFEHHLDRKLLERLSTY